MICFLLTCDLVGWMVTFGFGFFLRVDIIYRLGGCLGFGICLGLVVFVVCCGFATDFKGWTGCFSGDFCFVGFPGVCWFCGGFLVHVGFVGCHGFFWGLLDFLGFRGCFWCFPGFCEVSWRSWFAGFVGLTG